MSAVDVQGLSKSYGSGRARTAVLGEVSFSVAEGELVALLGPSGCGKTTCLRCVAGLERPDAGRILLDGQVAFSAPDGIDQPPEHRRLGMVFQSYALWPHMSVARNVAFPLARLRLGRAETAARVAEALSGVTCEHLADRMPGQLSGGQQQRVALARAVAYRPRLILFDEPLSNLDVQLRDRMRAELASLQARLGLTSVYVTHDQAEAMTLATRIVVMRAGSILQVDTPRAIYEKPATAFVASFMGQVNMLPVTGGSAERPETPVGPVFLEAQRVDRPVLVAFRPEHVGVASHPTGALNEFAATVTSAAYLGASVAYGLRLTNGAEWSLARPAAEPLLPVGSGVLVAVEPRHWMSFATDDRSERVPSPSGSQS